MIETLDPRIKSILAAGNQAPSGENCQPWHFVVSGNTIEIHITPERDQSYYNWGQRASYMAAGAVLENMLLAATAVSYRADAVLFPNSDANHVATITLSGDPVVRADPLEAQIFLRVTNRKRFTPIKLSDQEKKQLTDSVESSFPALLYLTDSREDIQRLSQVAATNEEIMLSNPELHAFFFGHINWTKEEDTAKRSGFYIKTLELPAPAQAAFYVIKNWSVMQFLLKLGFHKFVSSQNAATYAASSGFGAIAIKSDEPLDFVGAGRAFQRLWLTATKLGFVLQPVTGVLFFKLKIDGGEGSVFSQEHQAQITEEYATAQKIFNATDKRLACMFRIGSGEAPSAHAARFDLESVVTVRTS